ncbi:MAG: hypothetical protein M3R13_03380 [Armatimonadota bacterium]|nr:hypothetical protein [Armatimonadota bacterium]
MIVESTGDVIYLSGDLVTNQWRTIRTAAGLILRRHPHGVIVDCGGLTSSTPDGAETFYDMMHFIERKKARIIVANLPKVIKEALAHVPEVRSRLAVAANVDEARRSLDLTHNSLVDHGAKHPGSGVLILALSGGKADGYAIAVASSVAQLRTLKVIAMFPILVPQALPTSTPMPDAEERAERALKVANEAFRSKQIPVNLTIERTRSLASAVDAASKEVDERIAVIALPDADVRTGEPSKTASELLEKLEAEVILVRPPKNA